MAGFEETPPDLQPLLAERISGLRLKIEGSPMEPFVADLYRELEIAGLERFRPRVYLTDEWGCPDGEPIIGIPFYLADPKLAALGKEVDDLEDAREIRMYLRHEAGHAFNYAYRLHRTTEWTTIFGPFSRPYRDQYRPVPFDRRFVRHIEGWYAQKHPDEDFAETFAVWLTPGSRWRERYRGWPALRKLLYVDRVAKRLGRREPVVRLASTDITVEEMNMTVAEYFREHTPVIRPVDAALDLDLPDILSTAEGETLEASAFIRRHRADLVNKLEYWTGVPRSVVRSLVDKMEETATRLALRVPAARQEAVLVELTAYATALTMNFLTYGRFVPRRSTRPTDTGGWRSDADHRRPRR